METRRLSRETKGRLRAQRMRKRIEAKTPMFAEQFIAEELRARAGYYAGEDFQAQQAPMATPSGTWRVDPFITGDAWRELVSEIAPAEVFWRLDMEQITHYCGEAYYYWRQIFTMLCNYLLDGHLRGYRDAQTYQPELLMSQLLSPKGDSFRADIL